MKKLTQGLYTLLITGMGFVAIQGCARSAKGGSDTSTKSLTASLADGTVVYSENCVVCHQPDGGGVPHLNPPLTQTDYVLGDKSRLIRVVLNGLDAHEPINGETYNNVMPAHNFLNDQQIADVLTYVRNSFDNEASAITVAEVAAERARIK